MKKIRKNYQLIRDTKGETIVEVVIAFALLSIMMVMLTQSISYASRTDIRAGNIRKYNDQALTELQHRIATKTNTESPAPLQVFNGKAVSRLVYNIEVEGQTYTYYVYVADE